VLWIPFPSWETRPEVNDAVELGAGIPEYAENGMRALCMLAAYRDVYERVLDRLARRIVNLAERFPLGRSEVPRLDQVSENFTTRTAFVVAVIAPTSSDLPPKRLAHRYDRSSTLWRPFAERQALPIAEYAANMADRLGLPPRIVGFAEAGSLLGTCPAIVLIDPWIIARPGRTSMLRSAVRDLPQWAVPLVVVNADDPQYRERGAELASEVMAMLSRAGGPLGESVGQVKEFVEIMPVLVTRARRHFLKNAPAFSAGAQPFRRPRLSDPDAPTLFENGTNTDD
jgi:FxsC-like protein